MNKHTLANVDSGPWAVVRRPLPSVFLVRWEDEDSGWHSLQVIAQDRQMAIETISNAVGQHYNMQAYLL